MMTIFKCKDVMGICGVGWDLLFLNCIVFEI